LIVNQVQELEQAILARAERLATEYRERAQRSRDGILRDASERLRLREQREESIAKALGERTFRQQVQANELKMQSHLDRVRWNLVTDVQQRLRRRFERFARTRRPTSRPSNATWPRPPQRSRRTAWSCASMPRIGSGWRRTGRSSPRRPP
jgi:hypothetical protein